MDAAQFENLMCCGVCLARVGGAGCRVQVGLARGPGGLPDGPTWLLSTSGQAGIIVWNMRRHQYIGASEFNF